MRREISEPCLMALASVNCLRSDFKDVITITEKKHLAPAF